MSVDLNDLDRPVILTDDDDVMPSTHILCTCGPRSRHLRTGTVAVNPLDGALGNLEALGYRLRPQPRGEAVRVALHLGEEVVRTTQANVGFHYGVDGLGDVVEVLG